MGTTLEMSDIIFQNCIVTVRIAGGMPQDVHNAYLRLSDTLFRQAPEAITKAVELPVAEKASEEPPKEEPKAAPPPQRVKRQRAAEAPPKEESVSEPPPPEEEPMQKAMDAPGPDLKKEETKAPATVILAVKDLEGVKNRRDIVRRCIEKGITTFDDIVAACTAIHTESPALRSFKDIAFAMKPAYEAVLMENGAKNA